MKYTIIYLLSFLLIKIHAFDFLNNYYANLIDNVFHIDVTKDLIEIFNPSNEKNKNNTVNADQLHSRNLVIDNFNVLKSNNNDDEPSKKNTLNLKLIDINRNNMDSNLESWIERQFNISQFNLFANIKSNYADPNLININDINFSDKRLNISNGTIIASPSNSEPNYFFQWVRDSSLVALTVNNLLFTSNSYNDDIDNNNRIPFIISKLDLSSILINFINNTFDLQRISNWSGDWDPNDSNFNNLGEPKFNVDNSPFNFIWGRPQNDGPAIRLIAIIKILNNPNLIFDDYFDKWQVFEDTCKLDLHYILNHWDEQNFDLWEEVNSKHFYTSFSQLYSLKLSYQFLSTLNGDTDMMKNDEISKLLLQIHDTYDKIWNFINEEDSFIKRRDKIIVETPQNLQDRPSGLDIAVILASIFTHSTDEFSFGIKDNINTMNKINDPLPFDANDNKILNTLHQLIQSMKNVYPINNLPHINKLSSGVALGRYPEDIYDGINLSEGNPWFLATLAASNLIYKLIWLSISEAKNLIIPMNQLYMLDKCNINGMDSTNKYNFNLVNDTFWSKMINIDQPTYLNENANNDTNYDAIDEERLNHENVEIVYNSIAFNETMQQLFNYADTFLQIVKYHSSDEGELSEQFNKYTGYLTGASHLTWSYSEFINTKIIRDKVLDII